MFARHFIKRLMVFILMILLGVISLYITNKYYEGSAADNIFSTSAFTTAQTERQ